MNKYNYHGYTIREDGNVLSKYGKPLKTRINRGGYVIANFYEDTGYFTRTIHRLVALAFIPNPDNKPCVNHIDGDKTNNHVSNLEWCTHAENTAHTHATGLSKAAKGEDSCRAKLTWDNVREIRRLWNTGEYQQKEIAELFPINRMAVGKIIRNERWIE